MNKSAMLENFVINLDRHQGRMQFMATQLQALGVPFTRFPAVNGYDPAAIADADMAPFAPLSAGEIGCWESHRGIWREILRSARPAIVLEDDVVLASDFGQLDFSEEFLAGADVVKLDYFRRPSTYGARAVAVGGDGRLAHRLVGNERLASAYLVTPDGARRLLDGSRRYFEPVDELIFQQHSKLFWNLRIWKVVPALAAQMRFVESPEGLPRDIEDGIQFRTNWTGSDPRRAMSWLDRSRLRLRRLADFNTAYLRNRRIRRRLAAFQAGEDVITDLPAFATPDRTHIDRAMAEMR